MLTDGGVPQIQAGHAHERCHSAAKCAGKLLYMLMDSAIPEVQELLEFKCVAPLKTVHSFLEARGGTALLDDPLLDRATAEIIAGA